MYVMEYMEWNVYNGTEWNVSMEWMECNVWAGIYGLQWMYGIIGTEYYNIWTRMYGMKWM